MSRRPDQPTDGQLRPVPQLSARPQLKSLSRHDVENDPHRGSLLYEAVVFQDTSELSDHGWLDRLEAIVRLRARLAALEAETVAGFDDALHGVSADLGHRHPEPGDRDATAGERRWIAGDLRSVADEVALILTLRRGHATTRIHTSCELVHNFPATLHALTEGELTERAAFTIVSELSVLDDIDDIRAAEAAILDWARTHPLVDIKKACRREAARRSPAATDKAHQRARDGRSVRMYADDLGGADLIHSQDAVDAAAVMTSLSRAAAHRRRHGDTRTMDQLRADIALARLLPRTKQAGADPVDIPEAANDPYGAPGRDADHGDHGMHQQDGQEHDVQEHGEGSSDRDSDAMDGAAAVGAEATVVIHATGAEVRALINGEEGTGGEADHHGPIPQSSLRKHLLRALAQTLLPNLPTTPSSSRPGAAVHRARTTTGKSGELRASSESSEVGGTCGGSRIELRVTDQPPTSDPNSYTPSAAMDRYVRLRDRTCQFPGCNRPAEFTDLDHRVAFAAGGRTTAANLWCLCRHHHRLKHEGGWLLHPNRDGTYTWTSPTGRRYRNNATDP
ncbi:hypothetical protein GCM10009744_07670 [Kribbella alba]|uniref:HNH nuclease domain-containing protein n=1 Tax=Kribbella alba TaxID=190197 RepID=A0ABN2F1M1_9ACTN